MAPGFYPARRCYGPSMIDSDLPTAVAEALAAP
ncbi:MAG: hypothetical protein QOD78_33, partial [Chloroflexota bacterium]|nr:hypothetical protein [Chloroflexota bacterium]